MFDQLHFSATVPPKKEPDTPEQEAVFCNRYGRFGEKCFLLQPIA